MILLLFSELINLESNIKIEDLRMPEGVKVLVSDDVVIASITLPKEEKEGVEVDVSKVKVEGEEKREEEEKEDNEKKKKENKGRNKEKNK